MFEVFDSNRQLFGLDRFNDAIANLKFASADEYFNELYESTNEYCNGSFQDDMTMLFNRNLRKCSKSI